MISAPIPPIIVHADYDQVSLLEAARILAFSKKTVERMCQRGELASIGSGRLRRIAISDIKAFQARNRTGGLN